MHQQPQSIQFSLWPEVGENPFYNKGHIDDDDDEKEDVVWQWEYANGITLVSLGVTSACLLFSFLHHDDDDYEDDDEDDDDFLKTNNTDTHLML